VIEKLSRYLFPFLLCSMLQSLDDFGESEDICRAQFFHRSYHLIPVQLLLNAVDIVKKDCFYVSVFMSSPIGRFVVSMGFSLI
jgi:hypothetical protein